MRGIRISKAHSEKSSRCIWNSAVIFGHILRNNTQGYGILLFYLCPSFLVAVLDVDSKVKLRAQI
jgi:hypothetical protein